MATGTWEDFTSKYGFNDGASSEQRDYEARALLVAELNRREDVKQAKIRVIEFDRSGMHNGCLVVVLPNPDGRTDAELMAAWQADKIEEVGLPDEAQMEVGEIIAQAYAGDIHDLIQE